MKLSSDELYGYTVYRSYTGYWRVEAEMHFWIFIRKSKEFLSLPPLSVVNLETKDFRASKCGPQATVSPGLKSQRSPNWLQSVSFCLFARGHSTQERLHWKSNFRNFNLWHNDWQPGHNNDRAFLERPAFDGQAILRTRQVGHLCGELMDDITMS